MLSSAQRKKLYSYLAIILLIFLSAVPFAQAQDIRLQFDPISLDQISAAQIRVLLQDHYGFVWIGTDDGLVCYDGYEFKQFKNEPFDSTSITANLVNALFEDHEGMLWVGTGGGLNRFDRATGRFVQYTHEPEHAWSIGGNYVTAITEDSSQSLWVGTSEGGLNRLNRQSGRFTNFSPERGNPYSLNGLSISALATDFAGGLWVGLVGAGLQRYDPESENLTTFMPPHPDYLKRYPKYQSHVLDSIESLIENRGRIASILRVQNYRNDSTEFVINKQQEVLVISTGEALWTPMADLGWLENSKTQKPIWQMTLDNSRHSGGSVKNRIEIGIVNLDPGKYRLRFKSDDSHSFSEWNAWPPDKPGFWGIQVLAINAGEAGWFARELEKIHLPGRISSYEVTAIARDPVNKNHLWVGTLDGLNRLDITTGEFRQFHRNPVERNGLGCEHITGLASGLNDELWIGTMHDGLNKLEIGNTQFSRFNSDATGPARIPNNTIKALMRDQTGGVWAAVAGDAQLYRLSPKKFTHINPFNDVKIRRRTEVISIHEDSGVLWLGTAHGLLKYDSASMIRRLYSHDEDDPNSLNGNVVSAIKSSKLDTSILWIGNSDGGLNRFNKKTGESQRIDLGRPDHSVSSLVESLDGTIWLGTYLSGLIRYEPDSKRITRYISDPEDSASLLSNAVHCLMEDSSGAIWVGTAYGGLSRFEPESGGFLNFEYDRDDRSGMSNRTVNCLLQDRAGTIWIGTYSGGISRLDFDHAGEAIFRHYTVNNGLPSNMIKGILEDGLGRLWISSNSGLSRFDKDIEVFKNYTIRDGLQDRQFTIGAYDLSDSGEMFFGGRNGLNRFFPENVMDNQSAPRIVLTQFRKRDRIQLFERPPMEVDEIKLTHSENFFDFEFVALDYNDPKNIRYSYRLEGLDETWIDSGTRRFASYTDVKPGDYIFHATAANSDGVWNDRGIEIKVSISPPWWQTTGFRISAAFLIIGFLALGYRIRVSMIKAQKESLERQVAERTKALEKQMVLAEKSRKTISEQARKLIELDRLKSRFFANISHELRTPLTLILGPLDELMSNGLDDDVKSSLLIVRKNSQRLLRLINQLLDLSKLDAGKMRLDMRPDDLSVCIEEIVATFGALVEQKQQALRLTIQDGHWGFYFDRDKIEKIVCNILLNAVKFTPEQGSINVTMSRTNSGSGKDFRIIEIRIEDSGTGIPPEKLSSIFDRFYQADNSHTRAHEGTGIGLALTKELVELHGGEIQIKSEAGKGVDVFVTMELKRASREERPEQPAHSALNGAITLKDDNRFDPYDDATGKAESDKKKKRAGNGSVDAPIVLVIEDHSELRGFLKNLLGDTYRVVESGDGQDGFSKAEEVIPDLIISDIMMPNRDGYDLCRSLKSNQKTSHIPIILLTAKASHASKLNGLDLGADDYLAKPFDARELRIRVKNLIIQRDRLRRKYRNDAIMEQGDISVLSREEVFLQRLNKIIRSRLSDTNLDVEFLCRKIGMSKTQLQRKLRALTGLSAGQMIRYCRLSQARLLLEKQAGTVSEIAYQVGFNHLSYFAKCYKEQFGNLPSEQRRS